MLINIAAKMSRKSLTGDHRSQTFILFKRSGVSDAFEGIFEKNMISLMKYMTPVIPVSM